MMGYTVSALQISASRRAAFLLAQALNRVLRSSGMLEASATMEANAPVGCVRENGGIAIWLGGMPQRINCP